MSDPIDRNLGYTARRVGTEAYEIIDLITGMVVGWAIDGPTAMLIVFGLNLVWFGKPVFAEIDTRPAVADGVVATHGGQP